MEKSSNPDQEIDKNTASGKEAKNKQINSVSRRGQETIWGPRHLIFSTAVGGARSVEMLSSRDLETQSAKY